MSQQYSRAAQRDVVYLVAPSGHPNFGDEFIARAWLRYLATARPDSDVVVDCHTPGQAAVLLRSAHPRVTFVDTAWRICQGVAHLPAEAGVEHAARVVHDPGLMCGLVSGIELLAGAGTVHLLGGGYLNTVWPHHLALLAVAAAAVRRSGGRAVATGQGLLPAGDRSRRALAHTLQAGFEVFDVRDERSRRAASPELGARLTETGDDAWLDIPRIDPADPGHAAADRRFVFCVQSDLVDDFGGGRGVTGLTEVVTELIERWHLTGDQVAFVEGIPGADRVVFDRVEPKLAGAAFVPFTEAWQAGLPARAGQVWVSTRFHPHLLAAAAGASGLALTGPNDYYTTKHRSLIDAGSGWTCSDGTDLPPEPPGSGGFPDTTVQRLRAAKAAVAARIYPPLPVSTPGLARRAVRGTRRRLERLAVRS